MALAWQDRKVAPTDEACWSLSDTSTHLPLSRREAREVIHKPWRINQADDRDLADLMQPTPRKMENQSPIYNAWPDVLITRVDSFLEKHRLFSSRGINKVVR